MMWIGRTKKKNMDEVYMGDVMDHYGVGERQRSWVGEAKVRWGAESKYARRKDG